MFKKKQPKMNRVEEMFSREKAIQDAGKTLAALYETKGKFVIVIGYSVSNDEVKEVKITVEGNE